MRGVGGGEDTGSRGDTLIGEAVVHVVGSQEADAAVAMLAVVPVKEGAAVGAAVLRGSEALGEVRPVLERWTDLTIRRRRRSVAPARAQAAQGAAFKRQRFGPSRVGP